MDLKSNFEIVPGESNKFSTSKVNPSQDDQVQGTLTKNINNEPSCKRVKISSTLLRRSITNFNGYHSRPLADTQNSTIHSNNNTKAESTVQRNLNEGLDKAFGSIQLSSGPRMTPPIVILTDLTTKCIKSRRLL